MKYAKFLALVALAVWASRAENLGEHRACWEKAKTQAAMNVCADEEARHADAELDRTYGKLLSKAERNPRAVAKIRNLQAAWIAYRDAYMDAMYPAEDKHLEYGSVYLMETNLLRARLTRQQVTALAELLQQHTTTEN
jgi:uncharacterized protein YecT (DUF1311 family)